jgi:hypothetical protein
MNHRVFSALLGALSVSTAAVSLAAAPQYALIDLGSTAVAGAGMVWQPKQSQPAPTWWPSTGGRCTAGPGDIFAQYAIGNDVIAVGDACEPVEGIQAAKWTDGPSGVVLTDLGTLPGSYTDTKGPFSAAYDFNNGGDIVGISQSNSYGYMYGYPHVALHGFIYNNGSWTDLVPIAGPTFNSGAEAVNGSREVVGWTQTVSSTTKDVLNRAFVYIGGTMYNLTFYLVGGPTALLTDAYWIDCQGNIAAVGTPAAGGTNHSYLLVRQGPARTNCPK